ncbi:MAG: hypothetical protein OEQ14_03640 [Gammaproteobacteria bacterium]|nr:hypothetical protein [Gammaproteobacteria bacterium]
MLRLLPLLTGLLPLVAMFGALWIGIAHEVLPSCVPFIDGCVSISATGRKPPGSFLFRAIMLPQAALLALVWYYHVLWLRSLNPHLRRSTSAAILTSGLIGALALVVYVTYLGTQEPLYEFMRRSGIYFGFLGLALAQMTAAVSLYRFSGISRRWRLRPLASTMLGICVATFGLGILTTILKAIYENDAVIENSIEWTVSVLMQCYFLVMFLAWRRTGFAASVNTTPG